MTDSECLAALESGALPPQEFTHRAHVRAAYLYLQTLPFGAALDRMCTTLRTFSAAVGQPGRYHETITIGFMALVNVHRRMDPGMDWPDFASRHPQLMDPRLLDEYYAGATLASPLARQVFVLERRPAAS